MAHARIRSVNLGPVRDFPAATIGTSAIDKHPVEAAEVRAPGPKEDGRGGGLVGDGIADRRHHGGDGQAVYAVAVEELEHWGSVLGRELGPGTFGENLTTAGLDVDGAEIGQRWRVGEEVVLQVSAPRIPCRTFAGHLGEAGWVKRFAERGRTGAYLSVVTPGWVRPGDPVVVLDTPGHGLDVTHSFRAFMGDLDAARALLATGTLHPSGHAELAEMVARRGRG